MPIRTAARLIITATSLTVVLVSVVLGIGQARDKLDAAYTAAGFENIPANPTDIQDSQTLYREQNLQAALSALEQHAGDDPKLLKVGVLPYMAEFHVKDGQNAKGYRYYAKNGEMGEFKVKLIGPGSIEGSQFPYQTISAGATQTIAAAVADKDRSLRVTNMTIERGPVDREPAWSVVTESDDRIGIVFRADPDGSGLGDVVKR
jgi:hypothetical protein